MSIFYYPVPPAQPAPSTVIGDNYFGSQDVYINQNGSARNGQLGSGLSAGKITLVNYDPTKSYLGLIGGTFSGLSTPPVAPPITATVLSSSLNLSTSTSVVVTPITAYGGSASTSTGTLNVSISPALPAGLTLYTSQVNLDVSGPAPVVTGSGTVWNVVYTIASSAGNAPVVGNFYAVRGQTKISYNGIWECVATTATTITLRYYSNPAASGGATPPGQVSWNTGSTVTIKDSGQKTVVNPSNGVYYWYNSLDFTIVGTPTYGSPSTNYVVTFTDSAGQTASASFNLTIAGPAVLSTTVTVASKTLLVNQLATSFTPVTASGGSTPYTWSITPGLPAGLTFNTSTGLISGTPTALSPLSTYTVTVTDSTSTSSSKTFNLEVTAPALTTTLAVATSTLTATVTPTPFTPVLATGGVSPIVLTVTPSLPAGLLFSASTGQITGTPTVASTSTNYTVVATDAVGQVSSKTFTLTVQALPPLNSTLLVPSFTATKNVAVAPFIPVSGSGGYGTLTYSISPALPSGLSFNTSSGQVSGTATILSSATNYTVTISDTAGQLTSKTFSLTVQPGALTTAVVIATKTLIKGVPASSFIPVTASGGDGVITYSITPTLPAGLTFSTSTGGISGTPTSLQTLTTYTVTATDGVPQTSSKTFTLEVVNPPALTTTGITSKTLTQNSAAIPFTPVTASGGYGTLTYSISPALPSGLSFNTSSGQVSGTPAAYSPATNYTVTVNDQAGQSSSKTFSLTVNTVPLVANQSIPSKTLTQGVVVSSFTPVTPTGGLAPYSYAITPSLPSGLSFNIGSGAVTGTPTVLSSITIYTVTITDSIAQIASNTFQLEVIAPPALTTTLVTPSSTFYRNIDNLNITPVTASGGYGSITFSINPSLPAALSFNSSNGKITGTATGLSNVNYTITATDSLNQTSSKVFNLIITDPPLTTTLVVASKTLTRTKAFTPFTPVTSSGGSAPVTFSISPLLPTGLTFDVTTGQISGSPSPQVSIPATSYTVTATDSLAATSSKTFTLTINEPVALVTTLNIPTKVLTLNTAFTPFTPVTASGGDGAITYGISPALPSGLLFDNNTGLISGTAVSLLSTTSFTVTATDSLSQTSSKSFSLTVNAQTLTATTVNPNLVYTVYTNVAPVIPVQGAGGVSPLTYGVSPSLPTGLIFNTLTGAVSGTPTALSGATTYTVSVTDQLSTTVYSTFQLTVADVPPASLTVTVISSNLQYYIGNAVSYIPVTAAGGVPPYNYSILPALPAYFSFNPLTAEISGIPTAALATTQYTVTVTDQVPQTVTATFTITVSQYVPTPGTGASGFSGYSGVGGPGASGFSGYSGVGGPGDSGFSGFSGFSGQDGAAAFSGYSGYSGWSGYSGSAGSSGWSGYSGTAGLSGYSGVGGPGASGYSGVAGNSGFSGFSGKDGAAASSGYSGETGLSGYSGVGSPGASGYSGAAGPSGYSGVGGPGDSGYSGTPGVSGYSGSIGTSGYSGLSGYSSTSGYSGISGVSGQSGISGYSGVGGPGASGYSGQIGLSGFSGASFPGTIANSQIAYGSGTSITGNNNFTYNGSFIVFGNTNNGIQGASGNGAVLEINAGNAVSNSGGGGIISMSAGAGFGDNTLAGPGGDITLTGGAAGYKAAADTVTAGGVSITGGAGSNSTSSGQNDGGKGGNITLQGGGGGVNGQTGGTAGGGGDVVISGGSGSAARVGSGGTPGPGGSIIFKTAQNATQALTERLRINNFGAWLLGGSSTGSTGQVLTSNGASAIPSWQTITSISGYSGYSGLGFSGYSGSIGNSGYSGLSGYSSVSGYSGISGYSGTSGYSGVSGYSGISGYSGLSGYSGIGGSGTSGYSGLSGYSGISGISGYSGVSGYSGNSGYSGLSGYSGVGGPGTSGYSGISGAGASGYSGISGLGVSGYSGIGTSGYSGISGVSGYSGISTGVVKYNISGPIVVNTGTLRWYPENTVRLTTVYFNVSTPGTSTTEIDVLKNGVSIFGTKPTVSTGVYRSANTTVSTGLTINDYLTFNVTQAGTGAQDAVIYVLYYNN